MFFFFFSLTWKIKPQKMYTTFPQIFPNGRYMWNWQPTLNNQQPTRLLQKRAIVRASPTNLANFYTVWRMNNDFYLLVNHFFQIQFPTDSLSHTLSHLNIIFHSLFILFLITTHLPTFFYSIPDYYNRKKK